jgi:uncharacterized protein (DUF2141 family)
MITPRATFAGLVLLAGGALAPTMVCADPVPDPAAGVSVTVVISGLRAARGLIRACLTTRAQTFPECDKDPQSLRLTVPAQNGPSLVFRHVMPGTYAVSLFHDENSNGRLDKVLGIPSEGYGFSRNAPINFGPPKFAAARFAVSATDLSLPISVRYIL